MLIDIEGLQIHMFGQHVLEATDGTVIGCFSLPKYESAAYAISAEILDCTASKDSCKEYVLKTEFRFILSTIFHTSLTFPSSGIIVCTFKFISGCNAGKLGLKSLQVILLFIIQL